MHVHCQLGVFGQQAGSSDLIYWGNVSLSFLFLFGLFEMKVACCLFATGRYARYVKFRYRSDGFGLKRKANGFFFDAA